MNSKSPRGPATQNQKCSVEVVPEGWLWSGASSATFRADFSGDVGRVTAAASMSGKGLASGFDPMGGGRFSEQDMRQQKNLEPIPFSRSGMCSGNESG